MADYIQWNNAIIEYFTSGIPKGVQVYLSVDDDVLDDIGVLFLSRFEHVSDWKADFMASIKEQLIIGDAINLNSVRGLCENGYPKGIAFLAITVLAASRMARDEDVAETNYFVRLRQVLGLTDTGVGRPPGLQPPGVEQSLWELWNNWLLQNGWLPTAEPGNSVIHRYINYPLSQALLRDGDKERLVSLFLNEMVLGHLGKDWSREALGEWIQGVNINSQHIRNLLNEPNPKRFDAILDMIYEIYINMDWQRDEKNQAPIGKSIRRITAGILRSYDLLSDESDYLIYPKQPVRWQGSDLQVINEGLDYPLTNERAGWFNPLWQVPLEGGIVYQVEGDDRIRELVLPKRDFWILVRDEQQQNYDTFATWRQPELGETFLLICRQEYQDQMKLFRDEGLIAWDHTSVVKNQSSIWIEYRECMILSMDWKGIIGQHQDLTDALRPRIDISIIYQGGLKVPYHNAFIDGYLPQVMVVAFRDMVEFQIIDVVNPNQPVFECLQVTNKPFQITELSPGDYLITVLLDGKVVVRKPLKVICWDEMEYYKGTVEQPESQEWYCSLYR